MPKAIWNGAVIAEAPDSDVTIVEGNTYFPMKAVRKEYLQPSDKVSICPWKGLASYLNVTVNGEVNEDAAWSYTEPEDAAKHIAGHIAFWRGVAVEP